MTIAIKPRSAWNAGPNGRTNRGRLVNANLTGITVHWPGGGKDRTKLTDAQVASTLRSWRAQHRAKDWGDIGYNFLIDGHGHIWEGCGWYRGAHAGDMHGNLTTVGVQLITGTNEGPTSAQIDALRAFRTDHVLTKNSRATGVRPHSSWVGTECPGDRIRALIKSGAFTQEDDMPTTNEIWTFDGVPVLEGVASEAARKSNPNWTPLSALAVLLRQGAEAEARDEALMEVVKQLAIGQGIDPAVIEAAAAKGAEAGLRKALEAAEIVLSLNEATGVHEVDEGKA